MERHFGGLHARSEASYGLLQFFGNGGYDAYVVRTRPGAAALRGRASWRSGLFSLLDLDPYAINLLCVPDAAHLTLRGQEVVYKTAAKICEHRRAFLLCDMPARIRGYADALSWMQSDANPNSANGAVYYPRLEVQEPGDPNTRRQIATSGTIAGIFARTDTQHGVWHAPAGTEARLRSVKPVVTVSDPESRALNPRAINLIRTLPSIGTVVWGARTLRGDDAFGDAFKYVPVRRLALHIEQSLYRGLNWVVLGPNEESTWKRIRAATEAFLDGLFRDGALHGSRSNQAYFVRCGRDTMTESDIRNGKTILEVGIAPLRPAEFVLLRLPLT